MKNYRFQLGAMFLTFFFMFVAGFTAYEMKPNAPWREMDLYLHGHEDFYRKLVNADVMLDPDDYYRMQQGEQKPTMKEWYKMQYGDYVADPDQLDLFFFELVDHFDIHTLMALMKVEPIFTLLILFMFLTNKKFGFFNLFCTLFSAVVAKNLGEKFNNNYLFYSKNLMFFYALFLLICYHDLSGLGHSQNGKHMLFFLVKFPIHLSFTFFLCAFFVGVVNSGMKLPKASVFFKIPQKLVPFLDTIEFITYVAKLFFFSAVLFVMLVISHFSFKLCAAILYFMFNFLYFTIDSLYFHGIVLAFFILSVMVLAIVHSVMVASFLGICLNKSASLIKNFVDNNLNKPK